VLHVHGRQFLCHRLILAANSAYFDSIFQSRIAKAVVTGSKARNSQYYSKNPSNITKSVMMESLIISCTEPDLFQIFLNYMYTGQVTIDKSNVAELLRLSNNFMVAKLKEYCAEYLERFLDAENCLQVKEVGEKYRINSLAKSATTFVQNNLGEVINHEIMMELLPKQVENFVTEKVCWGISSECFRIEVVFFVLIYNIWTL
jgi:kelch-like protein 11